MDRSLVLIHGWSDHAQSFMQLGSQLAQALTPAPRVVSLCDYVSLDDEVTLQDLAVALEHAWQAQKLSCVPHSVDVVVHSLGGLVFREWLTTFYTPTTAPVRQVLMLAPANFGSPLAQFGRRLSGRLLKGWHHDHLFQVGKQLLYSLEPGSRDIYELALRDCFGPEAYYAPDKIRLTILTGDSSSNALLSGSDGVVGHTGANLANCCVSLDYTNHQESAQLLKTKAKWAYCVVRGLSHEQIIHPKSADHLFSLMVDALQVSQASFDVWCDRLDQLHHASCGQALQQGFLLQVHDQWGMVSDYDWSLGVVCQGRLQMLDTSWLSVHRHAQNRANTMVVFPLGAWKTLMHEYGHGHLVINLYPKPQLSQGRHLAGYGAYDWQSGRHLLLPMGQVAQWFSANQNLLLRVGVERIQADNLVRLVHSVSDGMIDG